MISAGPLMLASVKIDTAPAGVIRPIELFPKLVNHRLPSGPVVIPFGSEKSDGKSVFQTAPVGAAAMSVRSDVFVTRYVDVVPAGFVVAATGCEVTHPAANRTMTTRPPRSLEADREGAPLP